MAPVEGEPREVLNRMARGGLTGKVVHEKRLEEGVRGIHAMTRGKVIQAGGQQCESHG